MNSNNSNSIMKTNRIVLIISTVINTFLIVGYFSEYLKGGKDLSYVLKFNSILVIATLINFIFYFRDKSNVNMKYVSLVGYFTSYGFVLLFSDRTTVYTFMFAILVMYILYFDLKLMIYLSVVAFSLNVINIAKNIFILKINDPLSITSFTIQFCVVLMYTFSLVLSTKLSNKFNDEKINSIKEEQEKISEMLTDVLSIATVLDNNSRKVNEIVDKLANSTEVVSKSIEEIASGASETTNNICTQTKLTYDIQELIEKSYSTSAKMGEISKDTMHTVNEGMKLLNELGHKTSTVNKSNENVNKIMIDLREKSKEIENITHYIKEISEQTNMLSLNSAIESARAGEAGKGFSVVSDEIRDLAYQSSESAAIISKIILELSSKFDISVDAVANMINLNSEQNELIIKMQEIYKTVLRKINEVNENVSIVNNKINEILQANNNIVECSNLISSTSEESAATAHELNSVTQSTIECATAAKKLVHELIETSEQMAKYTKVSNK